jgi:hypothetical protein
VNLAQGWNSACYAGPTQGTETATASIAGQFAVIYLLAPDQSWSRFIPDRPELSGLTELEQFSCVLILVTNPDGATWTFAP